MTASKLLLALALSGALVTFGSPALAEPTTQEKDHARELMADAREKRDKSDLAGALESFKQADAIMHVPTTGFEVAKTQQLLGKLIEARETVDAIAKVPVLPTDPSPFAEARAKAEALGKELDKQTPLLKITVKSNAQTTPTVTIDDVAAPSIDQPVRVNPGKHVLVARGDDGEARSEITVAASETKEVELRLDKRPSSTTSSPTKGGIPTLSWIGFGVGAAGLVVGTVTGIMAISAESDISARCGHTTKCSKTVGPDLDSAKTKATISTVGFIVAGVGAAVGVVGLFVGKPATETKVGFVTVDFTRLRGTF